MRCTIATHKLSEPSRTFWLLSLGWLVLDQAVKYAQRSMMQVGESIPIIEDVFHLTYVENTGAAFSVLQGHVWIFIVAALAACAGLALLWRVEKPDTVLPVTATALLVAGALGNAIDRLAFGHVIDIFDARIIDFAVFNIADIGINVGVFLVIIWILFFGGLGVVQGEDR